MLKSFVETLQAQDPDGFYVLEEQPCTYLSVGRMFRRLYVAFGATKKFWAHCRYVDFNNYCSSSFFSLCNLTYRDILAVDGTFLRTMFKGILLLAAVKDANNSNLTLCFAIVDVENRENWEWFLNLLYQNYPGIQVVMGNP